MQRWHIFALLCVAFLAAVPILAGLIYWTETLITLPQTRIQFHFFAQILTGNWAPQSFYEFPTKVGSKSIRYPIAKSSLYLSLAIILNIGTVVAILTLINTIFNRITSTETLVRTTKEQVMRLEDAIGLRDELITGYIVHSFPGEQQEMVREKVIAAFRKAADAWESRYMPELGVGEKEIIKKHLQKEFIKPEPSN